MNSASWKSVTYCRTVGKETQKILLAAKVKILLSKDQVCIKFRATEEKFCHSLFKGRCLSVEVIASIAITVPKRFTVTIAGLSSRP